MKTKVKRVTVALLGGFVLLLGVAMLVLPGPALLMIPAGLAILATKFERPRQWLERMRHALSKRHGQRRTRGE
jgi:tellurite resistance protein TerC